MGHTSLKSSVENRRNKALRVCKVEETTPFGVLTVAQTKIQHHVEEQLLLLGYRCLVHSIEAPQSLGRDSQHDQKE
jgi:hypothetical protein